jgi:hypothetical protein
MHVTFGLSLTALFVNSGEQVFVMAQTLVLTTVSESLISVVERWRFPSRVTLKADGIEK